MRLNISKEDREFFEKYLEEHPVKENDDWNPDEINDDRMNFDFEASCSRLAKMVLEGKIK